MRLAPEGRYILIGSLALAFISFSVITEGNMAWIGDIFLFLFLFSLNFFRDPYRSIPEGDDKIVSPADGKIVAIKSITDSITGEERQLISIFLNVFNVHTNRMPIDGKFESVFYKKGKFLAAFDHAASDENEQTVIEISTNRGKVGLRQIAGLVARRIHCYAIEGNQMSKGDRLGFIMFGSRTDLILPMNVNIKVEMGQKVTGNQSIIGEWNG